MADEMQITTAMLSEDHSEELKDHADSEFPEDSDHDDYDEGSMMSISPREEIDRLRQSLINIINKSKTGVLYRKYKVTSSYGYPLPNNITNYLCEQISRRVRQYTNLLYCIRYDVCEDSKNGWLYVTIFVSYSILDNYVDLYGKHSDLLDENYDRYLNTSICIYPTCTKMVANKLACRYHDKLYYCKEIKQYHEKSYRIEQLKELIKIRDQLIQFIKQPIPDLEPDKYDLILPDYGLVRDFSIKFLEVE